jgi:hypothetical protein
MGYDRTDPHRPFTFHVRDSNGELVNVLRYQPDPALRGDGPKMLGLAGRPRGTWPNPEAYEGDGDTALWVEGETDVPAGRALGYPTFAAPGSKRPDGRWAEKFKRFRRVGVCGDPDEAGRKFASHAISALKEAGIEAVEVNLGKFAKGEDGEPRKGYDLTTLLLELGPEKAADVVRASLEESSGEDGSPPSTAELLEQVVAFVSRYVEFASEHQAVAVALWVAHSHVAEASFTTPYLAVLSAEPRSGKTTLLRVLSALCRNSVKAASISEAALFRTIEEDGPTLFLDEIDALFGGNTERSEPLRALLNAGNACDESVVIRCVGNQHERRKFNVFCPKVLAGIDNARFPHTVRDRSIVLRLRRGIPGSTEWWLPQDALPHAERIHDELAAWAAENTEALARHRPEFPPELHARAAEGWWPLLAIGDLAGGDWPDRAREAAKALSGDFDADEESRGVRLLADLRTVFGNERTISSAEAVERLNGLEESPWGTWHEGTGMRQRDLARILKPFGIKTKDVRVGDKTLKGFHRDDLEPEWSRYLGAEARQGQQARHPSPHENGDVAYVADVAEQSHDGRPNGQVELFADHSPDDRGNGNLSNDEYAARFRARMEGREW